MRETRRVRFECYTNYRERDSPDSRMILDHDNNRSKARARTRRVRFKRSSIIFIAAYCDIALSNFRRLVLDYPIVERKR